MSEIKEATLEATVENLKFRYSETGLKKFVSGQYTHLLTEVGYSLEVVNAGPDKEYSIKELTGMIMEHLLDEISIRRYMITTWLIQTKSKPWDYLILYITDVLNEWALAKKEEKDTLAYRE